MGKLEAPTRRTHFWYNVIRLRRRDSAGVRNDHREASYFIDVATGDMEWEARACQSDPIYCHQVDWSQLGNLARNP